MKCQAMLRLFKSQHKLCHAEATTTFLNHHFLPEVSHSKASNEAIYMSDYNKVRKRLKLDRVLHLCKPNKESNSGVLPYNINVTY